MFAGTSEGRELAMALEEAGRSCDICVATGYGAGIIKECTAIHHIHTGRLDAQEMAALMKRIGAETVVDATHPYAAEASANIREAAKTAHCRYLRLLREAGSLSGADEDADALQGAQGSLVTFVDSVEEAVAFLADKPGHILAATGSRELEKYTALKDATERVTARVLSTPESVRVASGLGFQGKNLICMQGPFSEEINYAMLKETGSSWMVTKESGKAGGFPEKVRAARRAGAGLVVVGRPAQGEGYSPDEIRQLLGLGVPAAGSGGEKKPESPAGREVPAKDDGLRVLSLIGAGMGDPDNMTVEAQEECRRADLLVGAGRMLAIARDLSSCPVRTAYLADEIFAYAVGHPEYKRIAVLLSGDTGFYSGARKIAERFSKPDGSGFEIRMFCGISSPVYLCARLMIPWEDVKLASLHGRSCNLISLVGRYKKVFALCGKAEEFRKMCGLLMQYGYGGLTMHAGCDLSYPQERILTGSVEDLSGAQVSDLCAVLIENEAAGTYVTHGLPDSCFERGKVPMTKEEIRSVSLSKLRLKPDSVIWDVGAGTGSVSAEMALRAFAGQVFAVEKNPEAVSLIRANARKLRAANLVVIEGEAPACLASLPIPTHVFIGGTSGNLKEIVRDLVSRNPRVRIVINAITLETLSEALDCLKAFGLTGAEVVSITAAKDRKAGAYHLMTGMNPVYIISCSGPEGEG